jgi:hypothetical protein
MSESAATREKVRRLHATAASRKSAISGGAPLQHPTFNITPSERPKLKVEGQSRSAQHPTSKERMRLRRLLKPTPHRDRPMFLIIANPRKIHCSKPRHTVIAPSDTPKAQILPWMLNVGC